jgi:hypothetical protein
VHALALFGFVLFDLLAAEVTVKSFGDLAMMNI